MCPVHTNYFTNEGRYWNNEYYRKEAHGVSYHLTFIYQWFCMAISLSLSLSSLACLYIGGGVWMIVWLENWRKCAHLWINFLWMQRAITDANNVSTHLRLLLSFGYSGNGRIDTVQIQLNIVVYDTCNVFNGCLLVNFMAICYKQNVYSKWLFLVYVRGSG